MSLPDDIQKAKAKLPLPELMRAIGDEAFVKGNHGSPFRAGDNKTCFGLFKKADGQWNFKDQVTGDFGDEIDYLEKRKGLTKEAAQAEFLDLAGIERETHSKFRDAMAGKMPINLNRFDWAECLAKFEGHAQEIAAKRGISEEFINTFHASGLIGWYQDGVAFPVQDASGNVIGCHYKNGDDWFYSKGCKVSPLTIGETESAKKILFFESQWDAMSFADRLGWHEWEDETKAAFVITRGAANGSLVADKGREGAELYIVPQNDKTDPKTGKNPAEEWTKAALAALPGKVNRLNVPAEFKDPNDWMKSGIINAAVWQLINDAKPSRKSQLTVRTVMELYNMKFDESDNYLGDRVIAAGQSLTLLGPGGVGKSRLLLQLAICMIVGKKFLGIETYAKGKKWLIIQSENSNRRLQKDLTAMCVNLRLLPQELVEIDRCLFIHTLETDEDNFMDVQNEADLAQLAGLIEDFTPEFVVYDPLNTFTSGDLNSDRDMRAAVAAISRITRKGNTNRVPIILHHALTGKAGAAKAVGWEKGSYGRNSKVLHSWARAQLNLSPANPENSNELVLAVGKNNNGRMFPEIGVIFDEERGIYDINPDFDPEEFRKRIGLEKDSKTKRIDISPADVAALFGEKIDRKTLVSIVANKFGCVERTARRAVESAESAGSIVREKGGNWNPNYLQKLMQQSFHED